MIEDADWNRLLCEMGVRPATATAWASAFADEVQEDRFSAGMDDMLDWLPQILHETALLSCLEERLAYNPERICAVWPRRFPTLASAIPFSHNPRALANNVYAGRMGNTEPNDGFDFAGKGPIMLTGRAAYAHVGDLIGQDLVGLPSLMLQPHYGLVAAIAWWEDRIPDAMLSDQVQLRRRVNGGTIGLEHCAKLAALAREVFA